MRKLLPLSLVLLLGASCALPAPAPVPEWQADGITVEDLISHPGEYASFSDVNAYLSERTVDRYAFDANFSDPSGHGYSVVGNNTQIIYQNRSGASTDPYYARMWACANSPAETEKEALSREGTDCLAVIAEGGISHAQYEDSVRKDSPWMFDPSRSGTYHFGIYRSREDGRAVIRAVSGPY